jgi:trehalose synthase
VLHLIAAGSRPPVTPPLYRDLGIEVELAALVADRALLRDLENGLRGAETALSDDTWAAYREATAALLAGWDVVISHGLVAAGVAVLRLTLDASAPDPALWERAKPLVEACAAVAVPTVEYAPPGIEVVELAEAIDPLGPGAADLPVALAGSMLRSLGVDTGRPCCCHLSAFDSWQDPQDAIDAFELARRDLPELQLVLAGEGDWGPLREVSDYAQDGVVLVATAADVELNALRQLARVALESALAPGPTVTTLETLWKRTPVISAGRRGAAHPVRDGTDGYLVDSPEQAAERLVELVRDPGLAAELGAAGHERVRSEHLVTRLLEGELALVSEARAATLQSP